MRATGSDRTVLCCYSVITVVRGCIPFQKGVDGGWIKKNIDSLDKSDWNFIPFQNLLLQSTASWSWRVSVPPSRPPTPPSRTRSRCSSFESLSANPLTNIKHLQEQCWAWNGECWLASKSCSYFWMRFNWLLMTTSLLDHFVHNWHLVNLRLLAH